MIALPVGTLPSSLPSCVALGFSSFDESDVRCSASAPPLGNELRPWKRKGREKERAKHGSSELGRLFDKRPRKEPFRHPWGSYLL
eukprot:scaffold462_cov195-Pinguiococcus_pyrenoidosus.AAC.36